MTNLLESLNDGYIEDGLVEQLYMQLVELEESLHNGLAPTEVRENVIQILESVDADLFVDVLDGGPFNNIDKAIASLRPIREARALQESKRIGHKPLARRLIKH
jgi:hypothetical protein